MTDIITSLGVLFFGGLAIFFFLTLLRVIKYGKRMADTTLRSGFRLKEWFTGSLPPPGHHPMYQTTTGIRARVGRSGLIIKSTRTLSRIEF